jgi:hypothetical protein
MFMLGTQKRLPDFGSLMGTCGDVSYTRTRKRLQLPEVIQ